MSLQPSDCTAMEAAAAPSNNRCGRNMFRRPNDERQHLGCHQPRPGSDADVSVNKPRNLHTARRHLQTYATLEMKRARKVIRAQSELGRRSALRELAQAAWRRGALDKGRHGREVLSFAANP